MAISPLKIPRLLQNVPLVELDRTSTLTLARWWNTMAEQTEAAVNGILQLPEIQAAIDAANMAAAAANLAAGNAQAAADAAQDTADANAKEQSIVNSYVANYVDPFIKCNAGGNVTIADHDRIYGDPTLDPTVAVTGDLIFTGEAIGAVLRFFYVDPTRAGGVVTYQYTVDPSPPPVQGGSTHVVGTVAVPAVGSADGTPIRPPGYTG